ncbi:MAG TPA: hypothetical protein VK158_01890 [Acidobacteriota bacterium]|nr:hypothetical protein [Acidobacteriota bacterium]
MADQVIFDIVRVGMFVALVGMVYFLISQGAVSEYVDWQYRAEMMEERFVNAYVVDGVVSSLSLQSAALESIYGQSRADAQFALRIQFIDQADGKTVLVTGYHNPDIFTKYFAVTGVGKTPYIITTTKRVATHADTGKPVIIQFDYVAKRAVG